MSSGKHSSAEVIELPSLPPDAIPIENFHELVGQEPVLPTAQENVPALSNVEPEPPQSAYSTSSTPVVSTQVSKETTATLASAEAVPTDGTAAIATKRKIHATEAIIEQATTADDWKQDLQTPTARKSDLTPNSVAASKTAPEFDDERTSKSVDSAFDQRLLDDLIQTYGELVPLAQASKTRVETSATRIEPSLRQLEISLSPEPKFVAADPVTAVDAAAVESAGASVPVRQHGDLDHQLKKIIKDYGEYDLYSHASHSSATLKRGGIAAFVVLGLVLSGFYFFRSPAKTNPPRANSVLPASEEPSPAVPQSAKENIGRFTSDGGAPIDLDKKPNDAKKSLSADKTKTK